MVCDSHPWTRRDRVWSPHLFLEGSTQHIPPRSRLHISQPNPKGRPCFLPTHGCPSALVFAPVSFIIPSGLGCPPVQARQGRDTDAAPNHMLRQLFLFLTPAHPAVLMGHPSLFDAPCS